MHWIDYSILFVYLTGMLAIGFYFFKKNKGLDDYYVGSRNINSLHVGLSVVATDVGGGFSIGLGGLGFAMGLSGSWLLFTGLLGAWLSAVFLIPKIKKLEKKAKFFTFPEVFGHYFNKNVAVLAAIISAIGYLGFTSSQILAGAKLASAAFVEVDLNQALIIMGIVAIVYTALGGIKAVIYTDTIQWIILMSGLILVGIPVGYSAIGGWDAIVSALPKSHLSFTNISPATIVNWFVTIVPIWFVAMTLYQRIYASKNEKEAKKSWLIAGLLEWPIMALMGVVLGLFARVAAEQGVFESMGYQIGSMDAELGLPLFLRTILPTGLLGLLLAAYLSAILSTADSCLMAASGNVVSDFIRKFLGKKRTEAQELRTSQIVTIVLGIVALFLASQMTQVLDLMLYSYAFMVSGLFVPILGALFWKKRSSTAAFVAMLGGGFTTTLLGIFFNKLPGGLDANFFGILTSAFLYIGFTLGLTKKKPFR